MRRAVSSGTMSASTDDRTSDTPDGTGPAPAPGPVAYPIVLFDGHCTLCNGFVDFVLDTEREPRLRFAPLQSEAAEDLLGADLETLRGRDTVVLVDGDGIWTESDAVLRIAGELRWPWRAARWGGAIPQFLRDGLYRSVARTRYRIFPPRETCRLPGPGERGRFL